MNELASRKPLRLLPGVIAVSVQWLAWFVVPLLNPEWMLYGLGAGVACGFVIILWWLLFSRAPWVERVAPFVFIPLAVIATKRIVDPSIAGGAQGYLIYALSIPVFSLALVAWAVATRHLSPTPRRIAMVGTILLGCGALMSIRTAGVGGGGGLFGNLHWRWTPTPEDRLLAGVRDEPKPIPTTQAAPATPDTSTEPAAAAGGPA